MSPEQHAPTLAAAVDCSSTTAFFRMSTPAGWPAWCCRWRRRLCAPRCGPRRRRRCQSSSASGLAAGRKRWRPAYGRSWDGRPRHEQTRTRPRPSAPATPRKRPARTSWTARAGSACRPCSASSGSMASAAPDSKRPASGRPVPPTLVGLRGRFGGGGWTLLACLWIWKEEPGRGAGKKSERPGDGESWWRDQAACMHATRSPPALPWDERRAAQARACHRVPLPGTARRAPGQDLGTGAGTVPGRLQRPAAERAHHAVHRRDSRLSVRDQAAARRDDWLGCVPVPSGAFHAKVFFFPSVLGGCLLGELGRWGREQSRPGRAVGGAGSGA